MRCPRCGEPLTKIDRSTPPPVDLSDILSDDEDAFNRAFDEAHTRKDESEHWECDNVVCDLSSPCYFRVHHPYRGPNSAPGDSWSISWIN